MAFHFGSPYPFSVANHHEQVFLSGTTPLLGAIHGVFKYGKNGIVLLLQRPGSMNFWLSCQLERAGPADVGARAGTSEVHVEGF